MLDINKGKKNTEKMSSMTKHFNYFFKNYYQPMNPGLRDYNLDTIKYEEVTWDLVQKFSTYIVYEARAYTNPDKELLKKETHAQYFSAFKTYLTDRWNDRMAPIPLQNDKTQKITEHMRRLKDEINLQNGVSGSSPLLAASDDDAKSLVALCMWKGDGESAEFLHMFSSCVGNLGRGSEVSTNNC